MPQSDFEFEAQQESVVGRSRPAKSPVLGAMVICTAIGLAGYGYYTYFAKPAARSPVGNEQFNTAQQAPNLSFDVPATPPEDNNKLVIQPPPTPSPPQYVAPILTPPDIPRPNTNEDEEARRLAAEAEAKRKQAEAARQARLRSPMIVTDNGSGVQNVTPAPSGGGVSGENNDDDANSRYAKRVGGEGVQVAVATRNDRIDALIPQGTLIRGVLETAIQSDLPGMVRAITSTDVYSFDGRRILLPKGTMLTGSYRSALSRGQTRVLIVWTRALRADGTSVSLGSYGTDDLGRSGLSGDIDKHYLERFGASALLSIIGGAASYVAGLDRNGNQVNGQNDYGYQAQTQAQQSLSQAFADMANTALKDSINIPPTIHVNQGTQIIVFVQRDLDFSALYPDPVKEALREIRHNRSAKGR